MRWVVGSLLGAAMVLACWAFWGSDTAAPPPVATAPESPGTGATEARSVIDAQAPPRSRVADGSFWLEHLSAADQAPTAARDDDAWAAVLRGRLTVRQRPWVHPAGVQIRLTHHWLDTVIPTESPPTDAREPVATTAADGTFAFRFRPGSGELFFLIDHGGAWLDYQKVPRVPRAGTEWDLGLVFVDERGGARGQVLDGNGWPLRGVVVRAVDATLADLASGLTDLPSARLGDAEQFDAAGTTAWGPMPKWVTRRDLMLPFPSATSDKDGKFELRGLRPGTHDLIFRHDAGTGSLRDVQVAATRSTEVGAVRLHHDRSIDLTFLGDSGQPWIDASVALVRDDLGYGIAPLRTNTRGEIHAMVADPGATRVVFTYPGDGPCVDLGLAVAAGPIVRVPRLPAVRVLLIDTAGVVQPGGRVRLFATGVLFRPVDRRLPEWMQPTELQPGLHVGKGTPGTVAVASVPGFAPAMAQVRPGDNTLTLLPLQHVRVRVHNLDGHAIAGATVRLQVHQHPDLDFPGAQWELLASDRARVGQTDEQGLFDMPVWGTWFSLEASHPDFADTAGPRFLPQPGGTIDLLLQRRASIMGTLTTQHRPASAGFRVRARQRPPAGNQLDGSGFLAEQLAVTGTDGNFAFRDLCAGIWELQPEFPATPGVLGATRPATTFASQQVLLGEGQELHTLLEANRAVLTTPQLAGIVLGNGTPIAGALVRVRPVAGSPVETRPRMRRQRRSKQPAPEPATETAPWLQQSTTDSFGDFDFAGLVPGQEYEVRVDLPQHGRLQFLGRRVVATPTAENAPAAKVDLAFDTGSLTLQCSQTGQPFANRMVRLQQLLENDFPGATFELLTDDLGRVVADDLPAGRWKIEPVHGGNLSPDGLSIRAGTITAATAECAP